MRICQFVARVLLLVAGCSAADAALAQTAPAAPPPAAPSRIAIEDNGEGAALQVLDRAGTLPFVVTARVVLSGHEPDAATEARLTALAARRVPVWLAWPVPSTIDETEPWRASLRRLLDRHGNALAVIELLVDAQPTAVAGFAVRLASTEVHASHDAVRLALGGPLMIRAEDRAALYTADLAPYVDLLSVPEAAADAAEPWLAKLDPEAALLLTAADPSDTPADTRRRLLEAIVRYAGTDVSMHAWPAGNATAEALRLAVPLAPLLTNDVADLDETAAKLHVRTAAGEQVSVRRRLLFDNQTFATYLGYWGDPAPQPLQVSITLAIEGTPVIHDLLAGTRAALPGYARNPDTHVVTALLPMPGHPVLVNFNEGAVDVFADRSNVQAQRRFTVAEVIARHQARQRAQDALVQNYIAHARMDQHFRPTIADPGYDVVTENRYFVSRASGAASGPGTEVEWEELSFSVNGSRWDSDRPPFPLLQPEKVLSLPLQLRFDDGYRYRLDGTERVDGYDCFVVRFEPTRDDAALYRGTVWIDRQTFSRIRVQAVQGRLAAPVVSNEEIQRYAPPTMIGNQPVFLFRGLTARQIMLIAGRNLLVERNVTFDNFRVNDPAFDEERNAARSSDRVMFRETDRGLRYYVKDGDQRIVSERATLSAKAMAMGTTFDPSYAFPLPIFGINYLDFEFGAPDAQLALLFAGVLAAGNIQRPGLGPFDASVDFFAIAVPSSDRVYDASGERPGERLLTWPLSTGVNLGWQYTPFQKAAIQYQFRFDGYVRDTTTAEAFEVPASTVTNGIGVSWEYRRGGYSLLLNGTQYRRRSWRPWGIDVGDAAADLFGPATYAKYAASLSRDFFLGAFQKIHLNGSWFGGQDLDRFSQYQFGMFDDTRIHGVPASGVRFAELAMARGSYSLNIFEQYRLDLFLEQAWGRDRNPAAGEWQPITGAGVAVNVRGPRHTIVRADFGKSRLPARYSNIGSTTLQIMVLKPLGS